MSKLVEHAEIELRRAGMFDDDSDYSGAIAQAVMALVKTHSEQEHSGGSHGLTLAVFNKVVNFKNLTPIVPNDFVEVVDGKIWQCRRASSKFSHDAGRTWHDIDKPLRFRRIRRLLGLREFAP